MYLHYHEKNFFWFKGLNVKKIINFTKHVKITDFLINDQENKDNRKAVEIDEKKLFLTNLYMGKYIIKYMDFIRKNEKIKIIPIIQKFPLNYSLLDSSDKGLPIHCDTSCIDTYIEPRYFGFNVYLNNDYEGGEVIFPLQNFKLKPEPGDLISYRSNLEFPHYVKKVTSGKKWILQGYFRIKNEYE